MSATRVSDAVAFAALGDGTRLDLLQRLAASGGATASRVARDYPISRQAVTRHLRVLEDAGFVRTSKSGRDVEYVVDTRAVRSRAERLEALARAWDRRLDDLKSRAEAAESGVD